MPHIMETLAFMTALGPVFAKPAFATFLNLAAGWILCPARHTITGYDAPRFLDQ